jgi:hypothetical protein
LDARRFVDGFIPAGTGVNPVEVYYERFNIREDAARLNALQEDDLVRECPDLDKLRTVVVAYSRTSYRKGNLQLILDWYANGTPANGKPSRGELAAFNGQLSDRDAALATRRALDASAKRTLEKFGATPTRGTRHADH